MQSTNGPSFAHQRTHVRQDADAFADMFTERSTWYLRAHAIRGR